MNLDWVEKLPSSWAVRRLRDVAHVQNSNVDKKSHDHEIPVRLCNYTDVYYNEAISEDLDLKPATATRAELDQFGLRAGDVIFTKDSESWNDIAIPAMVPKNLPGVACGYHLTMLRPFASEMEGSFLFRCLQATGVREQFWVGATGVTRYGLGQDVIKSVFVPKPPKSLQTAIANFLDRKTAAIDALIEKKERLIALLAEKRAALIHRAVTKGLDPDFPMKDSGVPWIGEIPAHWTCCQIRRLTRSVDYGTSTGLAQEGKIAVLRMNNIQDGALDLGDLQYLDEIEDKLLLKEGDILFNRTNSWSLVGKAALVETKRGDMSFASYLVRLRFKESLVNSGYLSHLINSPAFLAQARSCAIPSISQANLSASSYMSLYLVVPPLREQVEILGYLTEVLQRNELMSRILEKQIDRLKEYRQALITAAVTGQLDIPEANP